MSGRGGPGVRGTPARVQAPLLDRLIDDAPGEQRDPPVSAADSMIALRSSVRRDLEALLNARRRWRSWPAHLTELATSPIGYGIPDFAAGAFNDAGRREELRLELEETIRRFEPRFLSVRVQHSTRWSIRPRMISWCDRAASAELRFARENRTPRPPAGESLPRA